MTNVNRKTFDQPPNVGIASALNGLLQVRDGVTAPLVGTAALQVPVWNTDHWELGTALPVGAAGGDLSGTFPNPAVAKVQGTAVSSTAPTTGQAMIYNGTVWIPSNPYPSFTLNFDIGTGASAITTSEFEKTKWLKAGKYDLVGWTLSGDATGSIVLKVETATYANMPTVPEIMSSQRPTLSSARKNQATLSSAIHITVETFFRVTVVSATTVKAVSLALYMNGTPT